MQKLLKNRIVSMVLAIVLAMLALLMLLDGFGVGSLYIGRRIIHPLSGALLLVYLALALVPLIGRAGRITRCVLIGETVLVALAALAKLLSELVALPLFSDLTVCALIGLTLALRGVVLAVDAYLKKEEKNVPFWRFLLFLAMIVLGVWQLSSPLISDRFIILVVGVLALVAAAYFAVCTVAGFRCHKKAVSTTLPVPVDTE